MRLLSFTAIALLFAASTAAAQSRLIVTGELATVGVSVETGATRTLNRPGGSAGGVAVDGGRYIVSTAFNAANQWVVHAWAPKTGQLLATGPLPDAAPDQVPAVAGDTQSPRAFIWSGSTISILTAAGVTPLITDIPPQSGLRSTPRLMAFASISRTLFVVRQATAGGLEVASFTDAGVPIRSFPITAFPVGLAVPSGGEVAFLSVVSTTSNEAHRYDTVTGTLTHAANLEWRLASPDRVTLDESSRRVTYHYGSGGLYAFTFELIPVNAFSFQPISPSGACRFDVTIDERTGVLFTATTAMPYPYVAVSRTPTVTALDVVTPAVLGQVALDPPPDATSGPVMPCGGGSILLTPPVAPIVETPVVAGETVTLSWNIVRNATDYRVEASIGSGPPILTTLTNNQTSLIVGNVPPGTYTVRVRGVNDSGLGVLSAPMTVTVH